VRHESPAYRGARLMASTVANGPHQFGFYMGTKDPHIMHTRFGTCRG